MKTDRLYILFAHYDEPIPTEFLSYAKPAHKSVEELSERQLKKWKSRRLAYFLLHHIFDKAQLDKRLLTDMKKTESGRPYIDHPEVDFNITHSGEWVAVIVSVASPKKAVGIDLEHPHKTRRFSDLLTYYAGEQEITEINNPTILPELAAFESRFYLSWCLREAVLKSQGVGIVKLAEVSHSLSERTITSAHCPSGTLCFYDRLPFYLAYFFEHSSSVLSLPQISRWQNGQWITLQSPAPLIYQVN